MERLLWLAPAIILLLAAVLSWGLSQRVATRYLGYGAAGAVGLALVCFVVAHFKTPNVHEIGGRPWIMAYSAAPRPVAESRLALKVDAVSLLFSGTVLLGGIFALGTLARALGATLRGYGRLWSALLMMLGGVVLAVMSADLLMFGFGWGLTILGTALARRVVGGNDSQPPTALILGLGSGLLLIIGIMGLVVRPDDPSANTYGLSDIGTSITLVTWLALAIASMIALGLPPFSHSATNDESTPPLVHGTLLALGTPIPAIYMLLRLLELTLGRWPTPTFQILSVIGGIALVSGSVIALRSQRFGPLIGAQMVAQWGLVVFLLGRYQPNRPLEDHANTTLIAVVIGLALTTIWSTLLSTLALGVLERRTGTDLLEEQPLLEQPLYSAGLAYLAAGVLATGLPPLGGFWLRRWLLENDAAGSGLIMLPLSSLLLAISFIGPAALFWRRRPGAESGGSHDSMLILALIPPLVWSLWPTMLQRPLVATAQTIVPLGIVDSSALEPGWLARGVIIAGLALLGVGITRLQVPAPPAWTGGEALDRPGGNAHTPQALAHQLRWLAAFADPRGVFIRIGSSLEWISQRVAWILQAVSGRYYLTGILIAALTLILLLVQ